jgi:hypothetical protein
MVPSTVENALILWDKINIFSPKHHTNQDEFFLHDLVSTVMAAILKIKMKQFLKHSIHSTARPLALKLLKT